MTGDGLRTETTYLEGLTHAEDNAEAAVKGSLCFGGNELGDVSRHHSIACLSPVVFRSKLDPGLAPYNSSSILYFLSMLPQHLAQAIFYTTAPLPHSPRLPSSNLLYTWEKHSHYHPPPKSPSVHYAQQDSRQYHYPSTARC